MPPPPFFFCLHLHRPNSLDYRARTVNREWFGASLNTSRAVSSEFKSSNYNLQLSLIKFPFDVIIIEKEILLDI